MTEWGARFDDRRFSPTCLRCLRVVQNVLRPAWHAEWPEMKLYFDWVAKCTKGGVLHCYGKKRWTLIANRDLFPVILARLKLYSHAVACDLPTAQMGTSRHWLLLARKPQCAQ